LNLQVCTNNIATRELGIIGALKFENCKLENCYFTINAAKENKSIRFFCDSLGDKIVFRIEGLFVLHPVADLDFVSVFNLWA
jgi:hypothetical protein